MDFTDWIAKAIEMINKTTYKLVVYISEIGFPAEPEKRTIFIPVFKGGVNAAQKKKEEELLKLQWQGWDILGFCLRSPKGEIIAYE